ncbi:MAG: ABC transporter ATP-binding protein/permease [Alphaproteobacteria bacterium]|nr:ABC transporter ATP-binding protein/permease [Alphaproteobacteria bacterium]MBU1514456.1 ABC transporter ATP-binding protein/permease [Alphaproteobacteria bacterium]MBU2096912.1 ABC transporter ATP-binding protein/permease [Alphaproteobacteria bacterium]MBU2153539.1 ABC transporter ATP-binding protein/permease [Alphaproteobacteria bacterium]MBU2305956.1 ABC transporter ATP-binding protein/permease [Alphaproteobacteria bacterium]
MSESPQPELSARALVARVARIYMAPRWKGWTVAMLAAVVVAFCSAKLVQIIEPATNDLLVFHKPGALLWLPLTIAALAAARTVAQVVQATLVNRIGNAVVGDVQVQLFGKLVRADLAHLRSRHSGAYVSSVLYDAGLIREAATAGVVNYTQNALIFLGAILVMVANDWVLSLVLVAAVPIAGGIMRRFSRRTTKAAKGAMEETSALSSAIMESLDGVRVVKIENREAYEEARVAEVVQRRQTHLTKGANARARAAPATELLMTLIVAVVFAYAGWRSTQGEMNAGAFFSFIAALTMASQALRQLANLQTVFAEGMSAARRLFAALDVEPEVRDRPGAPTLTRADGALRFEDVSFSYGGDGPPALGGVTLEASRGETVALVGPSGGGKSTILNLIPRFYDVSGGRVTLDGRDVRDVALASLRDQIALVTQEPFLFDDSIRANIAYARPEATPAEVETAATAAAAHEFITALPGGYDSLVGEAGARLSGGQRQRIAIARAFLKDAPILLLDEATSALDTESEAQVQAALKRLMAGRTTLLIAHRLSTVRGADRIYVVDKGRIVETGDHAGLIKQRGLYARLAQSQDLEAEPVA